MTLLDTNVLLDIATADLVWLEWSENQIRSVALDGPICINPIIYAQLAPAFSSARELDRWLVPEVFKCLPLPLLRGLAGGGGVSQMPPKRWREDIPFA